MKTQLKKGTDEQTSCLIQVVLQSSYKELPVQVIYRWCAYNIIDVQLSGMVGYNESRREGELGLQA